MDIKKEAGNFAYGITSKKQKRLSIIITNVIALTFIVCFYIFFKTPIILLLVCYIILNFFINPLILFINNDFEIALRKYNKDLNLNDLEDSINYLLSQNLHSETKKEITFRYIVIMFFYDKEKALSMLLSLDEPKILLYKSMYEFKKIEYFLSCGKKDVAYNLLNQLKETKKFPIIVKKALDEMEKVYFSNIDYPNLEQKYKKINKKIIINISNLSTLIDYYVQRNKIEEAKQIARQILSYNTNLTEVNKIVNDILMKEV